MIDKIKEANKRLNAVVSYVEHDVVSGDLPLSGWSVALKDNFNMSGTITTASSNLLSNYKSIYNATTVDKLIEAGSQILVKTSMDELGMGGTNRNAATGPVLNPYCEGCISGGSSGGSASLAGANLVRLSMGSDTGDSIRKPASYCGVVGIKPSYGRISRYGVIPYAASLDHVGYFTQNVKDAAIALEVLAGYDANDMTSIDAPVEKYSELLDLDLKGKRMGVFKNVVDAIDNADTLNSFNNLLTALESKGAEIVYKEMQSDLAKTMLPTYVVIANVEASTHHASLDGVRFGKAVEGKSLEELMIQTRSQGFSSLVKERLIYGQYALEGDHKITVYQKAKKVRRLLVDAYKEMLSDVDVMLAPATPQGAPSVDDLSFDIESDKFLIGDNHMVINNFTGYPSMTLPMAKVGGLPVGVNVSTKYLEEAKLFSYANAFEAILDWKGDF